VGGTKLDCPKVVLDEAGLRIVEIRPYYPVIGSSIIVAEAK